MFSALSTCDNGVNYSYYYDDLELNRYDKVICLSVLSLILPRHPS